MEKTNAMKKKLNINENLFRMLLMSFIIFTNSAFAQNQKSELYKYKWCENNVDGDTGFMKYPIAYGDNDSIIVTITYKGLSHDSIIFNYPVIYGTEITRFKIEKFDESWDDDKTWSGHKLFIVVANKINHVPISIYLAKNSLSTMISQY